MSSLSPSPSSSPSPSPSPSSSSSRSPSPSSSPVPAPASSSTSTVAESYSLLEVLERDNQGRDDPDSHRLYELEELRSKDWDFSHPTLVKAQHDRFTNKSLSTTTSDSFKRKFLKNNKALKELNWNNILVAGGCVGKFIGNNYRNGDVDIFIYGLTEQEANKKVDEIYRTIIRYSQINRLRADIKCKKEEIEDKLRTELQTIDLDKAYPAKELHLSVVRTANTLTIGNHYQIIFRLYKSPAEILLGFDLGSSAIGFNGETLIFTELGRFAYEYGYNVIDTKRRSTSYESRIKKYFERDFGIIFPELDMTKVSSYLWSKYNCPDFCELPYMPFTYTEVNDNRITLSKFYKPVGTYERNNDYDIAEDYYAIYYTNIGYLLKGEYDRIIHMGYSIEDVINSPDCLSWSKIVDFYSGLFSEVTSSKFPVGRLTKYVTVTEIEKLFAVRDQPDKVKEIKQQQLDMLKAHHKELCERSNHIKWRTQDPGSQVTGSFNPIIEKPEEWYGDLYISPAHNG